MKNRKHKRRHHGKAHVDVETQRVRLGSETYRRDSMDNEYGGVRIWWYRVSKTRCRKDFKEVPFVPEEKRDHKRHEWDDVRRPLDDDKRKDRHLIHRLDHALKRALREAEKREKDKMEQLREDVLAMEEAAYPTPSSSAEDEKPRKKESSAVAGQEPISDRKHGVKLFSNNGKFFFRVAVYKSTKFDDCSSVYLTVAGKRYLYTLDKKNMKALREEVAKGVV